MKYYTLDFDEYHTLDFDDIHTLDLDEKSYFKFGWNIIL